MAGVAYGCGAAPQKFAVGMPDLAMRAPIIAGQYGYLTARGATGANSLDGIGLLTSIGEVSGGTSTATLSSAGLRTKLATTTVLNNVAGWTTGAGFYADNNLPYVLFKFSPADVVDVRMFVGNTALSLATQMGADDPAGRNVGLQFSTGRGDTEKAWRHTPQRLSCAQVSLEIPLRARVGGLVDVGRAPRTDPILRSSGALQ